MKRKTLLGIIIPTLSILVMWGCSKDSDSIMTPESQNVSSEAASRVPPGFVHGIVVTLDGVDYYLAGPPDGPNGARDIPGHYWTQVSSSSLLGRHYNTGPFGASKWWSSDAPDGAWLYSVKAVIDTWTPSKSKLYASKGFVHYHEFVRVDNGELHPSKVLWLQHFALRSFTLDGGPHPELAHEVSPGIDYQFIPNYFEPYEGDSH